MRPEKRFRSTGCDVELAQGRTSHSGGRRFKARASGELVKGRLTEYEDTGDQIRYQPWHAVDLFFGF
jgi:hypothetical protein